MKPKAAVTSQDVARLAGVSQSAVSRAFTPGASVAPATRHKIFDAAGTLGYRPNAIARTLITRRSRIIAVVVSYLENQFYPKVIELLSQQLQRDGYHLLLFISDIDEPDELLMQLMQYQVEGIVLASATLSSAIARDCARAGVPVVLFNRIGSVGSASSVSSDNVAGGRLAAQAFIDTGHQRIAFIAGLENTSTSRDREQGFEETLRAHGLNEYSRGVGHYSFSGARQATLALFRERAEKDHPDAVFVANDHMAIAVMDTLRHELGRRIPDDVSVMGFDNVPQAAWGSYRLTTVEQRAQQMTQATVSMLLTQVRDGASTPQHVVVPVELIVRDSVRGLEAKRR
jgi:DNA-binding LacI/PurR family transcriptional regulator